MTKSGSASWWRRSGSNRLPFECHSNALPGELRPHIYFFEFFHCFRLSIASNVSYYTVESTACQALFSKNLKILYIASTANFFERRTIGALRRWHQRAIRSTTRLPPQPLSTDLPAFPTTQICQKIHFSRFYKKSKSLFPEKPLNGKQTLANLSYL